MARAHSVLGNRKNAAYQQQNVRLLVDQIADTDTEKTRKSLTVILRALLAAQPVDDAFHLTASEFFIFAEGGHAVILFAVEPIVRGVIQDA